MKIYPRTHEDSHKRPSDKVLSKLNTLERAGSLDGVVSLTKNFYKEVNDTLFDFVVRAIWLRGILRYGENSYESFGPMGYWPDAAIGFFMGAMVGNSGKFLLNSGIVTPIRSYLDDFFPEFWDRSPFIEPEYYKLPYKHLTYEHLIFVNQHHDRLALLDYAEEHEMSIWDFGNWAVDQAFSYNEESGNDVYRVTYASGHRKFALLQRIKKKNYGK